MASRRTLLAVLATLGPAAAVACLSSTPAPSLAGGDGGTGSSGGSSSGSASSSGGSSGGSSSGAATASCTYTITGAADGGGTCVAVGAYAANNAITAFGITPETQSPVFAGSVILGSTPAAFQTGTYTPSNVLKASGEYVVITGSGANTTASTWAFLETDGGAVDGGFTLNLTSTGQEIVTDGGAAWPAPHGTFTVTLPPGNGTTGTVTGTATF